MAAHTDGGGDAFAAFPRRLGILRHGHAAPDPLPGEGDFGRPLDARGEDGSLRIGLWTMENGVSPDLIISSPARRARGTAEHFCRGAGLGSEVLVWEERVYNAPLDQLVQVLAEAPEEPRHVMLVGHNPGVSELASWLTGGEVQLGTASLAFIAMPEEWHTPTAGMGRLVDVARSTRG